MLLLNNCGNLTVNLGEQNRTSTKFIWVNTTSRCLKETPEKKWSE